MPVYQSVPKKQSTYQSSPVLNLSQAKASGGLTFNTPSTASSPFYGAQSYNPNPFGQVLSATAPAPYKAPAPTGGGSNFNVSAFTENANQNRDVNLSSIDSEYEAYAREADIQEQAIRQGAGSEEASAALGRDRTLSSLSNEQATAEQGITEQGQLAQKQTNQGLQGARDLYRQVEQANIAKLSGMGISSSSVSEALAERLGVETARRITGLTGTLSEVMQNLSKEKTRIQTFIAEKKTQAEQEFQQLQRDIQGRLSIELAKINNNRLSTAANKAQARAQIIQDANNAIFEFKQKAADYSRSLAQKEAEKVRAFDEMQQLFGQQQGLMTPAVQGVNNISGAGFNMQPGYNYAPEMTGQITNKKQTQDEYVLSQLFGY